MRNKIYSKKPKLTNKGIFLALEACKTVLFKAGLPINNATTNHTHTPQQKITRHQYQGTQTHQTLNNQHESKKQKQPSKSYPQHPKT